MSGISDERTKHLSTLRGLSQLPKLQRTTAWHLYEGPLGVITVSRGHAMGPELGKASHFCYTEHPTSCNSWLETLIRLHCFSFYWAVSFGFVFSRPPGSRQGLSLQWHLSFPMIISREADIFKYIQTGNLPAVRLLFERGGAGPLMLGSDGTGLLHVRASLLTISHLTVQRG